MWLSINLTTKFVINELIYNSYCYDLNLLNIGDKLFRYWKYVNKY